MHGWIAGIVFGGNWRFDDPESLCQEIQLELLLMARAGRVREPGAFQKLVYRVAKCACVDAYHRQRRRADSADIEPVAQTAADPSHPPDHRLQQRERLEIVRTICQRLPAACRKLWTLVYVEQKASAEIARALQISEGNVRVRVHRCLQKAREIYAEIAARNAVRIDPPGAS